jgi:phage-related protein
VRGSLATSTTHWPRPAVPGQPLACAHPYTHFGIDGGGKRTQTATLDRIGQEGRATVPEDVQNVVGYALYLAQIGAKHQDAKPLTGFGGAGVLEVVEDHDGDTYRAVYTVRFAGIVYVLHAFQKKSRRGISTPAHELTLIRARLKQAEQIHARLQEG